MAYIQIWAEQALAQLDSMFSDDWEVRPCMYAQMVGFDVWI